MLKAYLVMTNRNTKDVGINGCDCHDLLSANLAMTKKKFLRYDRGFAWYFYEKQKTMTMNFVLLSTVLPTIMLQIQKTQNYESKTILLLPVLSTEILCGIRYMEYNIPFLIVAFYNFLRGN